MSGLTDAGPKIPLQGWGQLEAGQVVQDLGGGSLAGKDSVEPGGRGGVPELLGGVILEELHVRRMFTEVVFLMVLFGPVKGPEGFDVGFKTRTVGYVVGVLDVGRKDFLLLVVVKPDGVSVLALCDVAKGIVLLEDFLQEVPVADNVRVKVDLEGFGVIPETGVRRGFLTASRVPDTGANHAREDPEGRVRAPESPQGKGCRVHGLDLQ